ncbi:MAG: ATP-binding protein [Candidatus Dormibacteria bacterium]
MRLEKLEITGFGPLAGVEIDLGARLTVIVGDNESGKTSVLRALRAALFGIDAGGPGRPTDRSDWSRWAPWSGAAYGVALTYGLADGRRIRVARRLGTREHACQVQELGGGDITAAMRIGRSVAPAQVHLGIDEAVFCATACASDDGLRLGAPDAPSQRATLVQEAIERLADSGADTTTTEALAALRDARNRIGSERRPGSPLGAAVNRLRELEAKLEQGRGRLAELAEAEERLRGLEVRAEEAEERRSQAQRGWLVGRLAAIARQQAELEEADRELTELAAQIEVHADLADFPVEAEDRVVSLAAELAESSRAADEAEARVAAIAEQRQLGLRRLDEIDSGLAALAAHPEVEGRAAAAAGVLRSDLAALLGERRHAEQLQAASARRDALRREAAATGLGSVPPASLDRAAALLEAVRCGGTGRGWRRLAWMLALAGISVAALGLGTGQAAVVGLGLLVAAAGCGVAILVHHSAGGSAAAAAAALRRLCPGFSTDGEGWERLRDALPRLGAIYREMAHEEVRIHTLAEDLAATQAALQELAARAVAVAAASGLGAPAGDTAEARVRSVIDALDAAAGVQRRRQELDAERTLLLERRRIWDQVGAEAAERRSAADEARVRLRRLLRSAGIELGDVPAEAVRRFRDAAEKRRRRELAARRHDEISRRAQLADPSALARLRQQLEEQLLARGGSPAEVEGADPLLPLQLHDLEVEAQRASQSAVVAATDASNLRARIAEMRRSAPPLADLEDERAACVAARDRALHQLAALQRAEELLEGATRRVHRDLAPRLAGAVQRRLRELTEGRYTAVNVDTGHFAVSVLGRERPDMVPAELLSHGTRDQVSLLLRLALAEVLSGGGEPVPLLLDEPLLSSDAQRRATALRFLWNISATNQVVLTTSDPTLIGELGACADADEPAVVVMATLTPVLEAAARQRTSSG